MQVRQQLPKALQKTLTLKAGELTLQIPEDSADEFKEACAIIERALLDLESRPVIPREMEDILGISSTERRRWLEDGRLPSAGTRTVKLRGRGTITFHVFDPQLVADILARDLVIEWREHDAEAAAERRRRTTSKAKQKLQRRGAVAQEPTDRAVADDDGIPNLRDWEEFAKTGIP